MSKSLIYYDKPYGNDVVVFNFFRFECVEHEYYGDNKNELRNTVKDLTGLNSPTIIPSNQTEDRIQRLAHLNSLNIKDVFLVNKFWTDIITFVATGYFTPNTEFATKFQLVDSFTGLPRTMFLEKASEILKKIRKEYVNSGYRYKGLNLGSNVSSLLGLSNLYNHLDRYPIQFKSECGSFFKINSKEELDSIVLGMMNYIQVCFGAEALCIHQLSTEPDSELAKIYSEIVYHKRGKHLENLFKEKVDELAVKR